jgi:16S rRNA (uracil1498-N3)-methyltransferase
VSPDPLTGSIPNGGGPLVYVDDLASPRLSDDDHHHLSRARRLRTGDGLIISDGAGRWRRARFEGHEPEPDGPVVAEGSSDPSVTVAFALVKGTRPELAVQKLTEVGIDRIVPFVAARSVVRWDDRRAEQNHRRLVKVSREAAMQSRRSRLPEVTEVLDFDAAAALPGACLADRGGSAPSLEHPTVLVGPEGGWDPAEAEVDLPVVSLGTGVLRAETAAIVAGGLLVALRAGLIGEVRPR